MANLFGTMRASLSALQTIQDSLTVTQNNVTNASAPGYARQRLGLRAVEFNPETGMAGGLNSSGLVSSRDNYAEATVRRETTMLAEAEATWKALTNVESALSLNDASGVPANLDRLYATFSAWSVSPNNAGAKENVYAAAEEVASSFQRAASSLESQAQRNQEQITTTLNEINTLAAQVRDYNDSRRMGNAADAGLDANLHVALERLSELIDIRTVWQDDGTVTVLAGDAGLIVGIHAYELRANYFNTDATPANPDALPNVHITTSDGSEVTSQIKGGQLAASLKFRNETLPALLGDSQNSGALNRLAKAVADRVNSVLASGYPPPHEPYHLFVYGSSAVSIAQTIRVNPTLAPAILDATDPLTIPPTVNGKALQLAKLANPSDPADMIDGLSYVAFFGKTSADVGRQVAAAKQETDSRKQLTAQARNLRAAVSGVSFDEEAVQLVQLERAYQATSKMIAAVDEMLEIVMSLKR